MLFNSLSGTLPTELALLTHLGALSLSYNLLSGTLPTELALMTNLSTTWLGSNRFSGEIPTEIALLPRLESFPGMLWALEGGVGRGFSDC